MIPRTTLRALLLPLAAAFAAALPASAQTTLATWNTVGLTNGGFSADLAPQFAREQLAVSPLTRAAGLGAPGSVPHKWVGAAATRYTTMSAALAAENYFTFTLAPEEGFDLSVSSLTYVPIASGTTGINAFQWQYSVDGGAWTDFGAVTNYTASTGVVTQIDGADFDVLSGSTATFRLVAWAGGKTNIPANTIWGVATANVGGSTADDVPAVAVFGTISAAAVPEPAAASVLLGSSVLALVAARRRRAV